MHNGGRWGVVYFAMVVQLYCTSVGFASGEGLYKDDGLPQ